MRALSLLFLVLALLVGSCSTVKKVGVNTTAEVIQAGSDEILTEGNWEFFSEAIPGNLKLMEGLWYSQQDSKKLLSLLVKGYAAYAFATLETRAYHEILNGEEGPLIDQVLITYEKAIFYGMKYLELKGITAKEFYDKSFATKLEKRFDETFSKEDYIAILYLAQAMGSSINLQRTNVAKVAYMGQVKNMLNWVCKKDPEIEQGNCGLFQAVIAASTPRLLGGSQVKAKKMFQAAMKKYPANLLINIMYLQFHLIPLLEEDEFFVELEKLEKEVRYWFAHLKGEHNKLNQKFVQARSFNLFNSIARKKYYILKKNRKNLF